MNKLFRIFNESQQSHHFGKNWKAAEDIEFNVGCSIVKLSACLSSLSQESAKLKHRTWRKKIKSSWLSCRCTSLCARPNLFQSQSWKENIFCVIWFMFWSWFCIVTHYCNNVYLCVFHFDHCIGVCSSVSHWPVHKLQVCGVLTSTMVCVHLCYSDQRNRVCWSLFSIDQCNSVCLYLLDWPVHKVQAVWCVDQCYGGGRGFPRCSAQHLLPSAFIPLQSPAISDTDGEQTRTSAIHLSQT